MAICSIRQLSSLAPFAFAANMIYLTAVGIVIYYFLTHLQPTSNVTKVGRLEDLPLFFGTVMFAFEGVSVVSLIMIMKSILPIIDIGYAIGESDGETSVFHQLEWRFELLLFSCYGYFRHHWILWLSFSWRCCERYCYIKLAKWTVGFSLSNLYDGHIV